MAKIKLKDPNAINVYEPIPGKRHVVMESARMDQCIAFAQEHKDEISGATISRHKGFDGESLSFLKEMPWLTRLMVCDDYQDTSAISSLKNLDHLQLSSTPLIDFSPLMKLRSYSGSWPQNNDSFYTMKNIRSLWLRKGSKKNNMAQLSTFTQLENLSLAELALDTLDGIEKITSLKSLGVHFCRNITSIDPVGMLKNLTEVKFENCKKISSFSPLANNLKLETISLAHCGDIDNIDFIAALPVLKGLTFYGTVISSNDLSPILKCKSLKAWLGFNDKKTYSHRCKKLNQALGIADK